MIVPTLTADIMIAVAYFLIPAALLWYVRKQREYLPLLATQAFWAFIVFITLCGLTHVMDAVILFYPAYELNRAVRILCAMAAVVTAIVLWPSLGFLAKYRA